MSEFKQAIIVRTDIKMSKGKLAAQVAHAAVEAAYKTLRNKPDWFYEWFNQGQKKVVLRGGNEVDLLKLAGEAEALGLPVVIIRDAGQTELPPGTLTAIGIGPAPSELLNRLTGKLRLL